MSNYIQNLSTYSFYVNDVEGKKMNFQLERS
jgi:hypothetical protein